MRKIGPVEISIAFLLLWLALYGGQIEGCTLPGLPTTTKATAATYVYVVRTPVPKAVQSGISKLNEQGILANSWPKDTTDGAGEVPDQYKVAAAAAVELPSLVVQAGDKVLRVVKSPTTEEQVLEAVQ